MAELARGQRESVGEVMRRLTDRITRSLSEGAQISHSGSASGYRLPMELDGGRD
jgi:hypothetical protein